jgi:hypothetical protein
MAKGDEIPRKWIADTAATVKEDTVSEMEWRLRVEELVLARFRFEIDWYGEVYCMFSCSNTFSPLRSCLGRLWRSEVEAMVKTPGPIATNVEFRRNGRKPCQCDPERRATSL